MAPLRIKNFLKSQLWMALGNHTAQLFHPMDGGFTHNGKWLAQATKPNVG